MKMEFSTNTGQLSSVLNKLPDVVKKKVVRNAVRAGARVIKEQIVSIAPYDEKRRSGTHLKDAIRVERQKNTNDIFNVGVRSKKAPHAHLVEYGTVKMQPRSFFRDGFNQSRDAAIQKMFKNMVNGINRESSKLAGIKGKQGKK